MNSWASSAAKQILQKWNRCGVSYIPKASEAGLQRALAWIEDQNLQQGVEEAVKLGLVGDAQSTAPTSQLESHSQVREEITPSIPATSNARQTVPEPSPANLASSQTKQPSPASQHTTAGTTAAPGTGTSVAGVAAPSSPVPQESPRPQGPTRWSTKPLEVAGRNERFRLLSQQVSVCKLCPEIACRRNKTVFGAGPSNARIVMFGEAPGADEDRTGEPFVGAAGQLMDKILVASGLKREDVYIMNSLKCRPPNNRTPIDTEIENCRPYFDAQLETIQPDYIVCWGAVAVRALLQRTDSIGRLRGKFHTYKGAKVLVTYHPAYLLRNPDAKKLTWEDMKFLMKELGIPIPAPKKPS